MLIMQKSLCTHKINKHYECENILIYIIVNNKTNIKCKYGSLKSLISKIIEQVSSNSIRMTCMKWNINNKFDVMLIMERTK